MAASSAFSCEAGQGRDGWAGCSACVEALLLWLSSGAPADRHQPAQPPQLAHLRQALADAAPLVQRLLLLAAALVLPRLDLSQDALLVLELCLQALDLL